MRHKLLLRDQNRLRKSWLINRVLFASYLFIINVLFIVDYSVADDFDHQHSLWESVLQQHVIETGAVSKVKYASLKSDSDLLDSYLDMMSAVTLSQYNTWNKEQKLAFLINAYNAFTIKIVIDHYPVESIKDIGSFFSSVWKKEFFKLLEKKRSLDELEHTLIRGKKGFNEPRIHFALVCASIGCPKLVARAYTADRLHKMLDKAAKTFLQDTQRNRFNAKENKLMLSKIFDWYADDFVKTSGSVQAFVSRYMAGDDAPISQVWNEKIDIEYLDYNWKLNDAS